MRWLVVNYVKYRNEDRGYPCYGILETEVESC